MPLPCTREPSRCRRYYKEAKDARVARKEVRHDQALEVLPSAWSLWKVNDKAMAFGAMKIKVSACFFFFL